MNQMKTILGAGLVGLTALGVTACAPAESTSTETPAASSSLTLVTGIAASPFYESMSCGAQAAADELGADLTVQAPDSWGAAGMLPVLEAVAATSPDGLLVVPTDPEALTSTLVAIKDSGAPIVELDQKIADETVSVTKIGSSDAEGGALAGDTMLELLGTEGGKVLTISAPPGADQQYTRAEAFMATIGESDAIEDLGALYSLSDVTETAAHVTATLAAHPDLAGIFVTNDVNAMGVIAGLEEAGALGDVTVVAYDAADTEIEALQEGSIAALVAQDPYTQGYQGVESALTAIGGGTPEAVISIPLRVLLGSDTEGIATYLEQNSGTC